MADPATWPFVSIIILNFNGKRWLKECLDSIEKSDYPRERYEVILGDNASTDDSVSFVRQHSPQVKIVVFEDNYGFCKSNNLCAKEALGEYLVFLNNDTSVTRSWLTRLVEGALSEPGIVSCASKIVFPSLGQKTFLNAAGGRIFITGSSIYDGWMQEDGPRYSDPKYTGFGCAAGVLVQKKFFLETGGFDEYYFHSVEEMDFGWRAWIYGYKVLYVPSAVMTHFMGGTAFGGKGMTPTVLFLVLRNSLYFMVKNFEVLTALRGLTLFFLKTLYTCGYALWTRNMPAFLAVGKAYLCFSKDLRKTFLARGLVQKQRKLKDRAMQKLGVFAGVRDVIQATFAGIEAQKKYSSEGLYDTNDVVKIRLNEKGDPVFFRNS